MKRMILTTAAFAAVILLVPAATAADTTWRDVSSVWDGDWSDPAHWTNGVPDSTKTAELPTSGSGAYTVTISTTPEACKTLTMHSDATLRVLSSKALQIGNSDGQYSSINGRIELLGSNSVLRFMNSHTVAGGGLINGQDGNAAIEIGDGETYTNAELIEGTCVIRPALGASDTTFINNGVVHVNAIGMIEVVPDSIGVSSGVWKVSTNANAILRIGTTSAGTHGGSINVSNGTLDVDYDFETVGQLVFINGVIDVAMDKTFKASS